MDLELWPSSPGNSALLQSLLNINPCRLTVSAIQIFSTLSIWTPEQRGSIIKETGNITDNTGYGLRV